MPALMHKNRGLSLIELMVGVVIGMIAIIIIMQVAITFEGQKRTTVGTAGAMDEGAVGLFTLRKDSKCRIRHGRPGHTGLPGAGP